MAVPPRSRWAPSGSRPPHPKRRGPARFASFGTSAATGIRCVATRSTMRCGSLCGCCGPALAAEGPAPEAGPREPARRLFFALWPDEAMRQAITQAIRKAVRTSGGRPMPAGNLHVTLAFLGAVPERRVPELAEVARAAVGRLESTLAVPSSPGESLELVFERLEHWRAAQLLCALPAEPPPRVAALARELQDALAGRGFAPDLKPFRPHVTVARKVMHASAAGRMNPVAWRFAELALLESRTLPEGALYSVVASYSLCSGEKSANNSETA